MMSVKFRGADFDFEDAAVVTVFQTVVVAERELSSGGGNWNGGRNQFVDTDGGSIRGKSAVGRESLGELVVTQLVWEPLLEVVQPSRKGGRNDAIEVLAVEVR